MELTIPELLKRYKLGSKSSLYTRLKYLGFSQLPKRENKSYADDDLIAKLDEQHQHLKDGGSLKTFVPTANSTVDRTPQTIDIESIPVTRQYTEQNTIQDTGQLAIQPEMLTDMVRSLASAMIANQPQPSKLADYEELEKAASNGWQLPTSVIKSLIGTLPRCKKGQDSFTRGSFKFSKKGKIGIETSWLVEKVTD